ncbi:uncharacterized protein PV09_01977 [Verruconis gallopava]|uniref:Uncharacterized protein n=1 Tax=Verruconis gallopava TaxID=253628 RepID=A0A0D2B779_9PEZI|nr:uncharacterized protein PV09_01977 [Verruconis gallopava]KIW07094.1 hypothetical protein PV09_01977 [Verruconis gallopava]
MENSNQDFQTFSFRGTSTSRDAPNPLRPYYIPPSIGFPPESQNGTGSGPRPSSAGRSSFPAAARELFNDIDYESYIPDRSRHGDGNGIADMTKRLVDQAIWNYTSVFLAQPFEVAKIVLQCHLADSTAGTKERGQPHVSTPSAGSSGTGRNGYAQPEQGYFDSEEDESDSDLPSYFTPTAPYETPSSPSSRRRRKPPSRSLSATPTPSTHSNAASSSSRLYTLELRRNDSIMEVISQLWSKEGAWGIWKGTNSTFVYNVLLRTIETWTRSFLSAMLDLPDATLLAMGSPAGTISILDSPNPVASIAVAVGAAGVAGLLLSPIDIVRTRLILTPVTSTPRALLPSLRALPSLLVPPTLAPITFLTNALPTFLSTSGPLFFRAFFHIDPVNTPATSSFTAFMLSLAELFTKLPLETVLRRGHVAYLSAASTRERMNTLPSHRQQLSEGAPEMKTIVPVGPYRGIMGSMWFIVREEGQRVPVSQQVAAGLGNARQRLPPRRGQGVHGLWRGWRVGFWGLVGMWCAGAVGGGSGDAF